MEYIARVVVEHDEPIDSFTALADPRRRRLLELLIPGEQGVNMLVEHLGLRQPEVSKHLKVLRTAGLVKSRKQGRERLYSIDGARMKAVQQWVQTFEKFWTDQLSQIKARAEARAAQEQKTQPKE